MWMKAGHYISSVKWVSSLSSKDAQTQHTHARQRQQINDSDFFLLMQANHDIHSSACRHTFSHTLPILSHSMLEGSKVLW